MTREEAIRELKRFSGTTQLKLSANFWNALDKAINALEQQPCDDAISRKWALDVVNNFVFDTETDRNRIIHIIRDTAPSVTLKQKQKPILDKVKADVEWIPIIRREPTEEEKAEYFARNGEELCYMLDNEMPTNGQEVLVSTGDFVSADIFNEEFYNFEYHGIECVDAWRPLPKPYKAESKNK